MFAAVIATSLSDNSLVWHVRIRVQGAEIRLHTYVGQQGAAALAKLIEEHVVDADVYTGSGTGAGETR